jgi:hypothetical protein
MAELSQHRSPRYPVSDRARIACEIALRGRAALANERTGNCFRFPVKLVPKLDGAGYAATRPVITAIEIPWTTLESTSNPHVLAQFILRHHLPPESEWSR